MLTFVGGYLDLYKGGLQRALFIPFIHELKDQCYVHYINSEIDYRLTGERVGDLFYVASSPQQSEDRMRQVWNDLTESRPGEPSELNVNGRIIPVQLAFKGIARFNFSDLCEKALGAADYAAVGHDFHTVLLAGVPKMSLDQKGAHSPRFQL
jgi:cell division protein ZapE